MMVTPAVYYASMKDPHYDADSCLEYKVAPATLLDMMSTNLTEFASSDG